jgi:hypothetical protein
MLISALLYDRTGTKLEYTVPGVHFNERTGRVPVALTHKDRVYLCFYGQSYNNASPLNPPVYREVHTQEIL